ncbi:right-handed parallel beta-helix repeat-containing protein [Methanobrevibacter sp.]|uniref:right-handed parallel beta-helix repeat-containing protein n=1 Tax=Methanobrevibacter sp. TaxID=66852 RepID=UPI00388D5264
MRYEKIIIMLVMAIFIFGVASVCASDVDDTATASADNVPVELPESGENNEIGLADEIQTIGEPDNREIIGLPDDGTFAALDNKIKTSTDSIIKLENDYLYEGDGYQDGITIDRSDITIDGQGHKIDADKKARIFNVQANNVVIKNITFLKGYTDSEGGAIYFNSGGTVTNCYFTDNYASRGGAVFFLDTGNVAYCNFSDNSAEFGGAVDFEKTGSVANCNFISNTALIVAGAVYFSADGAAINCNFINNNAIDGINAGALFFYGIGNVTNCNFADNHASMDGGAVYFSDTGNVAYCNFSDNSAENGGAVDFEKTGNLTNCNFIKNNAYNVGGAVYFVVDGAVTNCNFTDCSAFNAGAICFVGAGTVTNSNFINNTATDYCGGAIVFNEISTVENCNFTNNKATGDDDADAGAIKFYRTSGTVTNCNFINNSANRGGAVQCDYGGTFADCNFVNNKAPGEDSLGGAVSSYGPSTMTNCNFTDNSAEHGGAIYYTDFYGQGNANVINCIFINNSANDAGAILCNPDNSVVADTCIFKTGSDTTKIIRILSPTLDVDDFTTFYNFGDKLTFDLKTNSSMPVTNGNISISIYNKTNGEFIGNYSCISGDGWIVDLPVGQFNAVYDTEYWGFAPVNRTITVLPHNTFWALNNTINGNDNDTIVLDRDYTYNPTFDYDLTWGIVIDRPVTIIGNGHVLNASGLARIFNIQADNVVIKNITFINVKINQNGGAVYWDGDNGVVSDCVFVNNSANSAGAILWQGASGFVSDCTFVNNSAADAVIYFGNMYYGSNFAINDNIFLNNDGVAIYFEAADSSSNVDYNWFGNNATNYDIAPTIHNMEIGTWLFLNATVNPDSVSISESSDILFKLYSYGSNGVSDYDNSRLQPVNLTVTANNGDVDESIIALGDSVEYTYNGGGDASVTAAIENAEYTVVLDVAKANSILSGDDLVMAYRDGSAWAVSLTDVNANPIANAVVKVGILGKVYNRKTDADGVASLPINLISGTYAINATFEGDDNYEASFTNATVTVNRAVAVLTGFDLEMSYKDGSSWVVALSDADGAAIAGVKVAIGVAGKVYYIKTDNEGNAVLPINLHSGTYTVNASFTDSRYEAELITATIVVDKNVPVLSAEDLVMNYKDGSAWSVTLTDADGNVMADTYVKLTVAGKTYTRKTGSDGVVSLPINLGVGNYTVSASFDGSSNLDAVEISRTIVVNPPVYELAAEDVDMVYQDGTSYNVQITDGEGNPVAQAGVVIKVTINGKSYDRKTNADGIASLPINLRAGTYEITAEYNGKVISNTIVVNNA